MFLRNWQITGETSFSFFKNLEISWRIETRIEIFEIWGRIRISRRCSDFWRDNTLWEKRLLRFRRVSATSSGLVFDADSSRPTIRSGFVLRVLFLRYLCFNLVFIQQFRDSGCENCPFFKMEDDHERIVDVTTPNFNGYDLNFDF